VFSKHFTVSSLLSIFAVLASGLTTSGTATAGVRIIDEGTGPNGRAQLALTGQITKGDAATLKAAVNHVGQSTNAKVNGVAFITLELNSPGGDVMEAIEIGKLVRARSMFTAALRECSSACVFILVSGVTRAVSDEARIGLHRPYFDPAYFAELEATDARAKYEELVEVARQYFASMNADERAFKVMLRTPSDKVYYLSPREKDDFNFRGQDPAWEEFSEARFVQRYGKLRWGHIKKCLNPDASNLTRCEHRAYEQYPPN
jgi:ATP-dependent protease ClpP protease subunit